MKLTTPICIFAFGAATICPLASAQSATREFNIESQPISSALKTFTTETGINFVYVTEVTDGIVSGKVEGQLSNDGALSIMFGNTGLEYKRIDDTTIGIRRRSESKDLHPSLIGPRPLPGAKPVKMAQNQGPGANGGEAAAAEEAATSGGIEEIIVTAQRREQAIRDVGLSITAFSDDDINALRIQVPSDLSAHIPNLDMTSQLGSQNIVVTIRGIGLNDFSANLSPSVGVYIDQVFLASPGMVGFALFDLERVEVLKGPQGTLYGRNTTGGAINFITKKPGDEVEGYFRTGYGNFARKEGEAAVTVPLSENLSVRLAGVYRNRNSFFTNVSRGRLKDLNTYAFRGIVAANLFPNVETLLTFQYGRDDSSNILINPVHTIGPNCNVIETGIPDPANCTDITGFSDPTPDDPFSGDLGADTRDPFVDVETYSVTLRNTWSITENINLTSITGYQNFDRIFAGEGDANPLRVAADVRADKIEQISQELRLAGLTGPLDWIIGAFYSNDTVDSANDADFFDFFGFQAFGTVDQDTNSAAGFVDGRWQINDRFTVVGGARLTYEKRDFISESGFGTTILKSLVLTSVDDFVDKTDISGRIGVEYTPNENSLYYATFSKAFHSGGFFGSFAFRSFQLDAFGPESIFAYEIGGKWTAAEGRLQVNASAFYYNEKDVQTTVQVEFGSKLTNIDGTTHVYGLDLDFTAQPIRGLLLRGAVGLLDTELPAFVGDIVGLIPRGNQLPNAPHVSATGLARYEFPIDARGLLAALQVDFQFKDDTHREAQNILLSTAPSFTVVNAQASISGPDDRWEFAVWGKNINNDIHPEFIVFLPFGGNAGQSMAAPRTYGATLSYRF